MSSATAVENVQKIDALVKLSPAKLDELCARREILKAEYDQLSNRLKEQVEEFGFTPPKASKSKRMEGEFYTVTLSYGETCEIRDNLVEALEHKCPVGLFGRLFRKVTQYKLAADASKVLAGTLPIGAPSNLRKLMAAAVVWKKRAPALTVKKLGEQD